MPPSDSGDCSQGAIKRNVIVGRGWSTWRAYIICSDGCGSPRRHRHTDSQTHTRAQRARRDFIYRPVNTFSKLDIRDNNVNTEWCLLSHYYGRRRSGIIIYRVRVNLSFLFVSLYYIHSITPPPLHTCT